MILFEKYNKSIIDKKIYDTVMLTDVMELNNEKYFVVYGYLFNNKNAEKEVKIDEDYKNDTFFKRNMADEKSDIDAYYLIYNLDKKQIIKNKKQFIEDNMLDKNIRLDRTKCEEISIGGETAYKLNAKHSEYVFIDVNDENSSYLIMKNTKHGLYPENMITFNAEKNKAEMTNDVKVLQEMVKEIERVHLVKNGSSSIKFLEKIGTETNEEEDLN